MGTPLSNKSLSNVVCARDGSGGHTRSPVVEYEQSEVSKPPVTAARRHLSYRYAPCHPQLNDRRGRQSASRFCSLTGLSHVASALLLLLLLNSWPLGARAQTPVLPRLIIFSQPRGLDPKGEFVDMGYFLARSVRDLGRFDVVLYSPQERVVEEAVKAGRLTPTEVTAQLADATMEKVAEAVGAVYLVRVTAMRTRAGISAEADMFVRMGGNRWSSVFTLTREPFRSRDRRATVLDAIHAHVGAIVPRIATAPVTAPAATEVVPDQSAAPAEPARTEPPAAPQQAARTTQSSSTRPSATGPTTAEMLIDRFRRAGDTANLIVTLRRTVNERPRDARLRRDLVQALRLRGWTEAARDETLRALSLCGENAELRRILGELLLEMGQPEDAIRELERAVALEPSASQTRVVMGDAYFALGKMSEAEAAYRAARDLDPSNSVVRYRIARLRVQALRFAEAAAEMTAAREAAGNSTEGTYAETYADILRTIDITADGVAGTLMALRRDFQSERINREEAHKKALEARDLARSLGSFLNDVEPPAAYRTVQALYLQATALLGQASSVFASYLETRNADEDREAVLLQQEGSRQLAEARKALPKP